MENTTPKKYEVAVKKLPDSQVEITVVIPAADFDKARSEAIKRIGADIELPGFRKGHVPEKMLVSKIGESQVLEEMAEIAISRAYPEIIVSEKIDALGRPEVRITKIAAGNPLEFTLTTAVFPEITLPDYKKLAVKETAKKEEVIVSADEVEKTIEQIRKMRAQHATPPTGNESDEKVTDTAALSEPELPPFDDAFVKLLGDFESVDAFKTQLKENIQKEKERAARDKKRVTIMETIIANTKVELPRVIIEQELHRMHDEFAAEIERAGMTLEAYMKAVGKTEEDMHKEWHPDAEKRAKVQLITSKIANEEKIEPDEAQLELEITRLKEQYPEANEERIRGYLEMLLTNEKVFQFLEEQGEENKNNAE